MTENAIAKVDAAFRIHTTLGPGLLESVRQQPIPVVYENVLIETGFRALRALSIDFKKKILTRSRQAAKTPWDASTGLELSGPKSV